MNFFLCEGNAFFTAYTQSDLLGKAIFIFLLLLSVVCWSVLLQKLWLTRRVKKESFLFRKTFSQLRLQPLTLEPDKSSDCPNAFAIIYEVLKNKTHELFEKNNNQENKKYLQAPDVALLESHATATIASLTNFLEKNLFILSTIVTLAPFLGLLGTVYGILTTFTELSVNSGAGSNQAILGGISLALSTTVLGLVDAIPALIGYNYIKHIIFDFDAEMQRFATDVLSNIELQYRK